MLHSIITRGITLGLMAVAAISADGIDFNSQNRRVVISKESTRKHLDKKYPAGQNYFWVSFKQPPSPDVKREFHKKGIKILGFGSRRGNVYSVKITANVSDAIAAMENSGIFNGLEEVEPLDKILSSILDPEQFKLATTYDSTNNTIQATVSWYEKVNEQSARALLKGYGVVEILLFEPVINRFLVRSTRQPLLDIATEPEISTVYEWIIGSPCNAGQRRATDVDSLQKGHFVKTFPPTISWLSNVSYTGDSIWVWNGEHGPFQHIDFFEVDGADTLLRGDTVLNPYGTRLVKGATGFWGLGRNSSIPEIRMHGVHTGATLAGNG